VTDPPWESPARAAKTKANKRMHELQHPLGVRATIAADRVSGEGVTPPAAIVNFARASSFATTTTTAALEIESSSSSDNESMKRSVQGGSADLGRKSTGLSSSPPSSPSFSNSYNDCLDGSDGGAGDGWEVTNAQASEFLFVECILHYMDCQPIENGNRKAVELAIMVEAGTCVREMDPMKKEEKERAFLSEYMNIICEIPNGNFGGPSVCQAMLILYKGARKKELDGGQMWRYYKDQLNELRKFAYKFPGVGSISKLPSGTTQVNQMKLPLIIKLWKEKYLVSLLVDYCIIYSHDYAYLNLSE
jgi:hypothetical protein